MVAGGFDHAKPFEEWDLPICFGILRRRLEAELEGLGTREFIKVLRLLERHSLSALKSAVQHALEIGASSADAVRVIFVLVFAFCLVEVIANTDRNRFSRALERATCSILEYQQEEAVNLFCLEGRPHLKSVKFRQTDVLAYQSLLTTNTRESSVS